MASVITVKILGDASDFNKTVGVVEKKLGGFKGAISKIGSTAAGVFAGGAALQGARAAVDFLGDAVTEAREAAKIQRLTEQVIKTTGGAAGVTAAQVGDLAESISGVTGIDDDVIQGAQNLLLTFTNVKNQVGEGNDIFNQASQLATDMATALGTDANGAALQLGKALNDPVKGITALSRAGVSFTEQQKKQIKAMVASGDVLGAQKLILGELGKEFGGAAEAAADPMQKLQVQFNNIKEEIGTALLPALTRLTDWFLNSVIPAMRDVVAWVEKHWPQIKEQIVKAVQGIWNTIKPIVQAIQMLWRKFGDEILGYVRGTWNNIRTLIEGAIKIIQGIIKVVTGIIRGDWDQVWKGIRQIVAGVWDAIKAIVSQAINWIKTAVSIGWQAVKDLTVNTWNGIIDFVKGLPGRIASAAAGMFDGIKEAFRGVMNWIIRKWNDFEISVDVPDWLPGPDEYSIRTPNLPLLAKGGIVRKPTLAMVGERGPEAVIPLRRTGTANAPNNLTLVVELDRKVLAQAVIDQANATGGLPIRIRTAS